MFTQSDQLRGDFRVHTEILLTVLLLNRVKKLKVLRIHLAKKKMDYLRTTPL